MHLGTVASDIASDLASWILNDLAPGAILPSEAELATRFQVSRLTLREAIKLLEGRGLVAIARGKRATVRQPDARGFTDFLGSLLNNDPKGLFDLIELRLSLEVQSATLASKRATRASLIAIENELAGMKANAQLVGIDFQKDKEVLFHEHDAKFHEAIAMASGNRVLSFMFEAMAQPLKSGFFVSRMGHQMRGHTQFDTVDAHQKIFDAIKAGNARSAAEAMRLHLKDTERDIRTGLQHNTSNFSLTR
jgi:GntR family transcriptional repressor for pyruvate dehydrogenase complex